MQMLSGRLNPCSNGIWDNVLGLISRQNAFRLNPCSNGIWDNAQPSFLLAPALMS